MIVNVALLKEPLNWLTVWTMAAVLWLLFVAISRHPLFSISNSDQS